MNNITEPNSEESSNLHKKSCYVIVRDFYTNNIVDSGCFNFDSLIQFEESGYSIEFENVYDIKMYERYKSMNTLDKILHYLDSDEFLNECVERYYKEGE